MENDSWNDGWLDNGWMDNWMGELINGQVVSGWGSCEEQYFVSDFVRSLTGTPNK